MLPGEAANAVAVAGGFSGWSQGVIGGMYFYDDWRREVRQYLSESALYWLFEQRCGG